MTIGQYLFLVSKIHIGKYELRRRLQCDSDHLNVMIIPGFEIAGYDILQSVTAELIFCYLNRLEILILRLVVQALW